MQTYASTAKHATQRTKGFTLLELLVVVSILVAVAGIGTFSLGGIEKGNNIKFAKIEMQNIAKAVKQFKADTGYYPGQGPFQLLGGDAGRGNCETCTREVCDSVGGIDPEIIRAIVGVDLEGDLTPVQWHKSPANFRQLLTQPVFCEHHPLSYLNEWDEVSQKGWRGAYLQREGFVDIGCTLSADNSADMGINGSFDTGVVDQNCPMGGSNVLGDLINIPAIADPFSQRPSEFREDNPRKRGGILDWRSKPVPVDEEDNGTYENDRIGQPYLLFITRQFEDESGSPTLSPRSVVRLVSAGEDGVYGGVDGGIESIDDRSTEEQWCSSGTGFDNEDDLVLCF